jgi:hypothetical protein
VPVVAQQVPPPQVPSPAAPQAEEQTREELQVGVPLPQTVHAPGPAPQLLLAVPGWQVDAARVAGEQQPPLQTVSVLPPQLTPHVLVDVLQASSVGQSVATAQPHTVLPLTHA